jgi:hypothetical protein
MLMTTIICEGILCGITGCLFGHLAYLWFRTELEDRRSFCERQRYLQKMAEAESLMKGFHAKGYCHANGHVVLPAGEWYELVYLTDDLRQVTHGFGGYHSALLWLSGESS